MKWEMKRAGFGDIVRVSLGSIYHYGIFVSEDDVIQFGLPPTTDRKAMEVEVLSAPVYDFLAGGFLEVGCPDLSEKRFRKSPEDTVASAKRRLGERGYDILHNNCEHFANECAFGKKFSLMTESVRTKVRAIPLVHVYVAKFPFCVENEAVVPPERANEIESCSNLKVRQEKYFVWKLLESALMRSLGLKMQNINLTRTDNGKWECPDCYFSLSHSGNFVAVAVSKKPVGLDIEKCNADRFAEALGEKITTANECNMLFKLEKPIHGMALNALWTKKEAIFKLLGKKAFEPNNIETSKYPSVTKIFQNSDEQYFITVASEDADKAIFRSADVPEFAPFDL